MNEFDDERKFFFYTRVRDMILSQQSNQFSEEEVKAKKK